MDPHRKWVWHGRTCHMLFYIFVMQIRIQSKRCSQFCLKPEVCPTLPHVRVHVLRSRSLIFQHIFSYYSRQYFLLILLPKTILSITVSFYFCNMKNSNYTINLMLLFKLTFFLMTTFINILNMWWKRIKLTLLN